MTVLRTAASTYKNLIYDTSDWETSQDFYSIDKVDGLGLSRQSFPPILPFPTPTKYHFPPNYPSPPTPLSLSTLS